MSKYLLIFLGVFVLNSCKKDDELVPVTETQNSLSINISYDVDGQPLLFDTLLYTNAAGSTYGISRLWYYLSQISLVRVDSSIVILKPYQFVDASSSSTNKITLTGIPTGNYIGMQFNIGLDSGLNITNILPTTMENLNMEWPVQMGGGYHFMKFEGHASDSAGDYGFAMHLGLNGYLVKCSIWQPVQVNAGETVLGLTMNPNEWFRNPQVYDFNVDGNYSMGLMSAMLKLKQNGSDVFSLQ